MHPMKSALLFVAMVMLAQASPPQPPLPDIAAAAARYEKGEHAAALAMLSGSRLTAGALMAGLDRWVTAGDAATISRRQIVAATLGLDTVWTATRALWLNHQRANLDPWGRVTPSEPERTGISNFVAQSHIGAWAVQRIPRDADVVIKRRLVLAALGVIEDGHAWHALQDVLPGMRALVPDEPRLALAGMLARTNRELGSLRLSMAGRIDIMRDENLGSAVTGRIPRAQAEFDALAGDPAIGGESQLRSAFLELRLRKWQRAADRLSRARTQQTEPLLQAAADYFLGWTHSRMDQTDAAIASYRRALAITPTMRNLATELSALLFLRNERSEAYAILDRALNASDPPADFVLIIERADGRFVTEHLRALREALR